MAKIYDIILSEHTLEKEQEDVAPKTVQLWQQSNRVCNRLVNGDPDLSSDQKKSQSIWLLELQQ